MRRLITILAALALLAGCGAPIANPTPAPAPLVPIVGELGEAGPQAPSAVAGYLLVDEAGARLVDRLRFGDGPPLPVGAQIWLGSPQLPADAAPEEAGGARYGVAQVRGTLEGPGSYGPDGAASYQILDPAITPLSTRDLTIELLLSNPGLYEGQPVRLSGQLLSSPSSTLLVEAVGPGGVPDASSLQIKVAPALEDADIAAVLPPGETAVRYGPARLLGIWRRGALYPLAVLPAR